MNTPIFIVAERINRQMNDHHNSNAGFVLQFQDWNEVGDAFDCDDIAVYINEIRDEADLVGKHDGLTLLREHGVVIEVSVSGLPDDGLRYFAPGAAPSMERLIRDHFLGVEVRGCTIREILVGQNQAFEWIRTEGGGGWLADRLARLCGHADAQEWLGLEDER